MQVVILDGDLLGWDVDLMVLYVLFVFVIYYFLIMVGEIVLCIVNVDIILVNKVVFSVEFLEQVFCCCYIGILVIGMNNVDLDYCK